MPVAPQAPPAGGSWRRVFYDPFDDTPGASGPTNGVARTNWNIGWQTGPAPAVGALGVINTNTNPVQSQEIQYYGPGGVLFPGDGAVHFRLQNATTFNTRTRVSGMLTTAGLLVFNPRNISGVPVGPLNITGPFLLEVRMRVPGPNASAGAYWPVVWMTNGGNYGNGASFPGGTSYQEEIDLWEWFDGGSLGSNGDFHLHAASEYNPGSGVPSSLASTDLSLAYHTYSFWSDGSAMKVWVDGVQATNVAPSSANVQAQWAQPQYLMLAFQAKSGATVPSGSGGVTDMMVESVEVFASGAAQTLVKHSAGFAASASSGLTASGYDATNTYLQKGVQALVGDQLAYKLRYDHHFPAANSTVQAVVTAIKNAGGDGILVILNSPAGLTGSGLGGQAYNQSTLRSTLAGLAAAVRSTAGPGFQVKYECGNEVNLDKPAEGWGAPSNGGNSNYIARYLRFYKDAYAALHAGDALCLVAPGSCANNVNNRVVGAGGGHNVFAYAEGSGNRQWSQIDWHLDLLFGGPYTSGVTHTWTTGDTGSAQPTVAETGADFFCLHPYPIGGSGVTSRDGSQVKFYTALASPQQNGQPWRQVKWLSQAAYDAFVAAGRNAEYAAAHSTVDITECDPATPVDDWRGPSSGGATNYITDWLVWYGTQYHRCTAPHLSADSGTNGPPGTGSNWVAVGTSGSFTGRVYCANEQWSPARTSATVAWWDGMWRQQFALQADVDGVWWGGPNQVVLNGQPAHPYSGTIWPFMPGDSPDIRSFKWGIYNQGPRARPNQTTAQGGTAWSQKGSPNASDGPAAKLITYANQTDIRAVTAPTVPGQVTGVNATAGNQSVDLSWSAPGNGGAAITDYIVVLSPPVASPYHTFNANTFINIGGLTNGQSYTATVTAVNSVGQGAASAPVSFTPEPPPTLPGKVTGLTAAPGDGQVQLNWDVPDSGGSPLFEYSVTYTPPGTEIFVTTNSKLLLGLVNGQQYSVVVHATNAEGDGPDSDPVTFTPQATATVPGKVLGLVASARNQAADLAWSVPPDGGSPVTGYVTTVNPGGTTWPSVAAAVTVTGLQNGLTYTATTKAHNAVGDGPASDPVSFTPQATVIVPPPPSTGPSTDDILDGNLTTRVDRFSYELLGRGMSRIGTLDVDLTQPPSITFDTSRNAAFRTLDNLVIPRGDLAEINTLTDRVRVNVILQNDVTFPLGVFRFGSNAKRPRSLGTAWTPSMFDDGWVLDQKASRTVNATKNTHAQALVRQQLEQLGIDYDTTVIMDAPDVDYAQPQSWKAGTSRYQVLKDVALLLGCYPPFYTADGKLRFKLVAPDNPTADHVYNVGERIIEGSALETDDSFQTPNQWVAIGNNKQGELSATYNVPDSAPYSFAQRGVLVTETVDVPGAGTRPQAAAIARAAALRDARHVYLSVSFAAWLDPRHDGFDVFAYNGAPYRETSFSYQCKSGAPMTHNGVRLWQ